MAIAWPRLGSFAPENNSLAGNFSSAIAGFAGGIGAATDAGFGVSAKLLPAKAPAKASDKPNRAMMRAVMMLPI
jgi:hypothetical protein